MRSSFITILLVVLFSFVSAVRHPQAHASISNALLLKFYCAAREDAHLDSQGMDVYWNGVKVKAIRPLNYAVATITLSLAARPGNNTLAFKGTGISDGFGLTFTSVQLLQHRKDLINNGKFDRPNVGKGERIF